MCFQRRNGLLKHIRLMHSNRSHYACLYSNCPCNFKTLNALHIHISRVDPPPDCTKPVGLIAFSCPLCPCRDLSTERDLFSHLGLHFKSHETVACVFKNCNFKTNIHGSYHSHRNRKHKPHTADDFKTGIVTTTAVSQALSDNSEHDES